jgi:cyclase
MRKKRLIFTLLYNKGFFMLSRNFRLQKVGDFEWLRKHYNFEKISFSIDELIILDVTRDGRNTSDFSSAIKEVIRNVFVPVSVGGGIRTMDDAEILLNSGADKLVLNTALHNDNNFVKKLIERYGSQVIIGSVDFLRENGTNNVYICNGTQKIKPDLDSYLDQIEKLSIGEIYLNSIMRDGTGQGYEIESYGSRLKNIRTPLILAGGAGNHLHFIDGLRLEYVDAVATANLLNFLGDSLPKSREEILKENLPITVFPSLESFKNESKT